MKTGFHAVVSRRNRFPCRFRSERRLKLSLKNPPQAPRQGDQEAPGRGRQRHAQAHRRHHQRSRRYDRGEGGRHRHPGRPQGRRQREDDEGKQFWQREE